MNSDNYVITYESETGKFIYMHRFIFNLDSTSELVVDHINHKEFDNRKINLRVCTHQNNTRNGKVRKNNTSGVTGVVWNKEVNKWQAQIMVDGKGNNLGFFNEFEDAVSERIKAEIKYFGEYRYREEEN